MSGLDRAAAGNAFLSAVLECAVYVSRRVVSSDEGGILLGEEETEMTEGDYQAKKEAAKKVVSEQVKRAWEEVSSGRLKVEERGVAELLARTLKTARATEEGLCFFKSQIAVSFSHQSPQTSQTVHGKHCQRVSSRPSSLEVKLFLRYSLQR